jgi:hypothetical protein
MHKKVGFFSHIFDADNYSVTGNVTPISDLSPRFCVEGGFVEEDLDFGSGFGFFFGNSIN